jgi:hypothetical protein
MRLSVSILAIFALFAGLAVVRSPVAAAPPPAGGATRGTTQPQLGVAASCKSGFSATPASIPLIAKDVKYQCTSSDVSCPFGYDLDQSSQVPAAGFQNNVHFIWFCKSNGAIPPSIFSAKCPAPGLRGPQQDPLWESLFCFIPNISCPSGFDLPETDTDIGVKTLMPLTFFYTCKRA